MKPGTDEQGGRQIQLALAEHRNGHFARAAELREGLTVPGKVVMLHGGSLLALNDARLGRKEKASLRLIAVAQSEREASPRRSRSLLPVPELPPALSDEALAAIRTALSNTRACAQ